MGIGKRIREAREHLNMTQSELAQKVGVTTSAITNYETGVSHPKEPVLYRLFEALGCDANYLFQDAIKSSRAISLSCTETELLKKYRQLPDSGKQAVDTMIDSMLMMAASQNSKSEDKDTIILAAKGGGLTKKELTPEQVDKLKKW
jgi:hypothetical protein